MFFNKKGTARAQFLYTQSTETANAPGYPSSPPQLLTSFYYYKKNQNKKPVNL